MGTAVVFPGQGTQEPGMGSPWRDHTAWSVVERAEAALGEPLAPLVLDPTADLTRTRDAQLAVLLTSLVAWTAARPSLTPIAFAGHSLGQVTALIAGGVLTLDEGVRFAARRAELTQQAADRRPGRMVALVGADTEQARDACAASPDECWLANLNARGQVVVAGTPAGVDAAAERARELGVRRVLPLDVGGAFHTPLMQDARVALVPVLAEMSFAEPNAPVVSNEDGVAYADGAGWRTRLANHVVRPVRWQAVTDTLVELGADELLEVGHGRMLAGLAKRGAPGLPVHNVDGPDALVPSEVR